MSAPAGWYPTPEGRERYWDGQAWTDHERDIAASAIPPTQALPTYGQQPHGQQNYGQQAYQQPAYGQPPVTAPRSGGKGCLIAAIVVGGLALVAAIVAVVLLVRFANDVKKDPGILFPSSSIDAPGVPSPSDALPSPVDPSAPGGLGNPVTTTVGGAFTVGDLSVAEGWSLKPAVGGMATFENLKATSTGAGDGLGLFEMVFSDASGEVGSTFCTTDGNAGQIDISCLPVDQGAATATTVTVSGF